MAISVVGHSWGLLRRYAPRNDEKGVSLRAKRGNLGGEAFLEIASSLCSSQRRKGMGFSQRQGEDNGKGLLAKTKRRKPPPLAGASSGAMY